MIRNANDPVRPTPAPFSQVAGRAVLDPADLQQFGDFAARLGQPVRHVLLAAVLSLLHRHAELGPTTLALDLSASFPSSFPDASVDLFPFACAVDESRPFSHVVRAVAAAEAAAIAGSVHRRAFVDRVVPYRVRVTVPTGWGEPAAAGNAPRSFNLSIQAGEGLMVAPADGHADLDRQVVAIFRRLRPVLEGASAAPDATVASLPILTPIERHELLETWNATRSPLPPFSCAQQLVEAQVARTPHVTAVRFGDQSVTYCQLDVMANRLARDLQVRGVGPDSLVGICLERGLDMVVAVLATLKAGGAYLPLDPNYPPDRLAFMLEDSAAAVVITQRRVFDRLGLRARSVLCLDEEPVHLYADVPDTAPVCRATPENLAYVIYTSGSTGKPKGVQVPHRAFVNFLSTMADAPGMSDHDVLLAVTTLSFDIAGLDLFLPLTVGARINLLPREVATDGVALRRALESSDATILQVTPATWRMLINAGWQGTPGLRMFCGGEAMTLDLARQLLSRGAELWNMYGPTETTVYSTIHRVDGDTSPVPIGRPIANTRCYILDPSLQPVPLGLTGELYIAGHGLARGYLNRPDLTAERFPADPFAVRPGSRMYRTGDVCRYRPDGQIEYLGRNDHQVKINGFRIELGEIEDALLRLPGIRQACCISRDSAGTGGTQLVAYVVADPEAIPDPADVRHALRIRLPAHMVPAAVVPVASFPLTPSGKVDRKALVALPPLVGPSSRANRPAVIRPAGDIESRLAAIWKDILRVPEISVTGDFFESGGDSLLAVSLAVQIEKEFGRTISPADLLSAPTILALAERLRSTDSSHSLIMPLQTSGRRPILFCLPGMGGHCISFRDLAPILGPDQPLYGVNLPGTDGVERPGREVRAIAMRLLREIRAIQPEGPYHFAGYSFGGLVAYEMARQLRAAGQRVAIVVLIDAFGPDYPRHYSVPRRLLRHAAHLISGDPAGRYKYVADKFGRLARRLRRKRGPLTATSQVEQVLSSVRDSAVEAEQGYDYPPYAGPVALFRCMTVPEEIGRSFADVQNGWGSVVTTPISLFPVPARHLDLFHQPYFDQWAHDLRDLLRRVQSE